MSPYTHRRSFGFGPRPVLAIHCSLAHSGAWRGMATALSDMVTLHAFDLPSHGKSGDWDGYGVMHDTATDMALSVLDDLGPVDVIGHSFGATVALRLAVEHPEHVRSVIMYEPVFFAPAIADDPDFGATYAHDMGAFDAALDRGDHVGAARAFNNIWGNDTPWEDIPQATRDYMAARIEFVRASAPFLVDDCAGLLTPGQFNTAQMPALLLRGADSTWAQAVNHAITHRLPDAIDISLKDVGHMGPITDPKIVARTVRSFLNRV